MGNVGLVGVAGAMLGGMYCSPFTEENRKGGKLSNSTSCSGRKNENSVSDPGKVEINGEEKSALRLHTDEVQVNLERDEGSLSSVTEASSEAKKQKFRNFFDYF